MRMLLVGELNETLRSLSECLSDGYQVQICSDNPSNVKDMIRLLRPAVVVLNVMEMKPEIEEIFTKISEKMATMPIVVIGTTAMYQELQEMAKGFKNSVILSRPIGATEVLEACNKLLEKDTTEENKDLLVKEIKKPVKKILVVDDNALVLRNIKSLLEKEYQIVLANTGEKALDIMEKDKIDLVLLDYAMPGMDGKEVFERMLGDEAKKNIPVVFLTSVAEKNQIFEVLKNRPFGYILKPPSNEKIMSVIKEALN